MSTSLILQDWITLKGAADTSVVQAVENWPDLGGYVDVQFHTQFTNATGTGGRIYLQTSPTRDDGLFADMASVSFTATPPVLTPIRFASASTPLSRYVRWKIAASAGYACDITFRIWMTLRTG